MSKEKQDAAKENIYNKVVEMGTALKALNEFSKGQNEVIKVQAKRIGEMRALLTKLKFSASWDDAEKIDKILGNTIKPEESEFELSLDRKTRKAFKKHGGEVITNHSYKSDNLKNDSLKNDNVINLKK